MSKKFEPTPYELMTHKGRQINDATDPNYCGSCSIDIHCAQVRDPKSWVHSSIKRWEELGGPTQRPVETKYATIDRDELKRLQADSAELARMREPVEGIEVAGWSVIAKYPHMPARSALFFTEGEADSQGFKWCFDDGVVSITPLAPMPKVKRAIAQAGQLPEGFVLVPVEPTEAQWGGLARAIVFWMRSYPSNKHTPATLVEFITSLGHSVPEWMGDETEMRAKDHVISKGTIAVLIYKAMLAAAPQGDSHE